MKKLGFLKKLILPFIFLIILTFCVCLLYRVFRWKDTCGDYLSSTESFYSLDKNTVDALFIGPSYTYSSINPAIIWEKAGITSFNLSVSSQDIISEYYYAAEAVKTQNPKVVCICYAPLAYDGYQVNSNLYRNAMSMKLSPNNYKLVKAIASSDTYLDIFLRWPIVHSRYKELNGFDFVQNNSSIYPLGYLFWEGSFSWLPDAEASSCADATPISQEHMNWVNSLIELSQKENFKLIFTLPEAYYTIENMMVFNGFEDYLSSQGIEFINFHSIADEVGISYDDDFVDYGHMNYQGAEKISTFFANYLTNNADKYGIISHLDEVKTSSDFSIWNDALEYYNRRLLSSQMPASLNSSDLTTGDFLGIIDAINSLNDDYIIVAGIEGNCSSGSRAQSAFYALGFSEDEWNQGGTYVKASLDNNRSFKHLTWNNNDYAFYQINSRANTLSVLVESNGHPGWPSSTKVCMDDQIINEWDFDISGLYLMIFDEMTGEFIFNGYITD